MSESSTKNASDTMPGPSGPEAAKRSSANLVSEFRQIVFSNEGLRMALMELERKNRFKSPAGIIVSCQLNADNAMRARLTFHDELMDEQKVVELDEYNLAAALMQYCMKARIPIPKKAEKSLQLVDGNVALSIRLT